MRILPLAGSLCALLGLAGSAQAVTVVPITGSNNPRREPVAGRPLDGSSPGGLITRADCEDDAKLVFIFNGAFIASNADIQYIQIWARKDGNTGTSCTPTAEREGMAGTGATTGCRLVIQFEKESVQGQQGVQVPIRNILQATYQQKNTGDPRTNLYTYEP
ncbi:MAG: hypothetical protein IPJ34_07530 [Myxococcales bacterium]|nr:hypothetical protein [Myxococcales bacterium]